jgi:hypothetical protein
MVRRHSGDTSSGGSGNGLRACRFLGLLVLMGSSLACSQGPQRPPVYPVTGSLKFQGEPAAGAFLVFHPTGQPIPGEQKPTATVQQDGTFTVTSHGEVANSEGAPAGEYAVTVEWFKLLKKGRDIERGPNVIPSQYGKPETTPLKVKVEEKPNALPAYDLTK